MAYPLGATSSVVLDVEGAESTSLKAESVSAVMAINSRVMFFM